MMKCLAFALSAGAFAVVALSAEVPAARADRLTPVAPGHARLAGPVGEKLDRFLDHRVRGDFAKEVIFPEARAAFEKPDDDTFNHPAEWERPFGMWKGEFWGKLMISACRTAALKNDRALKEWLHEEALRLIALQRPDGYLGTYADPEYVQPQDWQKVGGNPTVKGLWCWNLWCRKYTMWGLLACHELTGDARLLAAVEKSMDQEIEMLKKLRLRVSETGTFVGMPSSSVLKPLLLLYHATGKERYLAFARQIIDDFRRADGRAPNLLANSFSGQPVADWYPCPWKWAKAYEMLSCLDGILEWSRTTGDESALEAMRRVQALIEEHETNPLFSVGYNDQFANAARQPNGVTEPCDAIHWIRFNLDLFWMTGETRYADAIELAFYNAFLAAVFRDGTWGARAVRSHAYHITPRNGQSGMKHQHCCVNNMPRTIADVTSLVAAKEADGTLCVAFYCDATADIGGDRVTITGNYPYGEAVTVTIDKRDAGLVRFRVPAWSATDADRGTWRTVRAPAGRSTYTLAFDMRPRLLSRAFGSVDFEPAAYDHLEQGMQEDWRVRMWMGYRRDVALRPHLRHAPAAEILRGPLLLAKARVVGTPQAEIESQASVRDVKPKLSLAPIPSPEAVAAWNLTIDDGVAPRTVPVCDFPSAGDRYEDGGMRLSVWF